MPARRRRLPLPAFATTVLACLALASPALACDGADLMPSAATLPQMGTATLCLLNEQRAQHGLGALTLQAELGDAALQYSQAMVAQRFFAHVSPAGQQLADRLASYIDGSEGWGIGENLAWGSGSLATPGSIVDAWMHSAGHRANILNGTFREIGLGIVPGSPVGSSPDNSATYTTEFGTRSGGSVVTTVPVAPPRTPAAAGKKQHAKKAGCAHVSKRARAAARRHGKVYRARAGRCVLSRR